jgi:hypothetical protein
MYRVIGTIAFMSPIPLAAALVLVVVVPVVVLRAYARIDDEVLTSWGRARGVELTPENRSMVGTYLRRARVLRTWGAVAGALLPTLVELASHGRVQVLGFGTDGSAAPYSGPVWIFIGYLVGALFVEVSLARPVDPMRRSASLVRRELSDYLPLGLLRAQRALALVVVLGVVAIGVVPFPENVSTPDALGLVTGGAFFAAFAAGLEALERWLVRRPQPFTDPSLVAADDAIRAQSVNSLAGGGLALLLVGCSGVFAVLTASDVPVLRWTMWLPALVAFVLSIRACLDIGQHAWHVRRRVSRPERVAPA